MLAVTKKLFLQARNVIPALVMKAFAFVRTPCVRRNHQAASIVGNGARLSAISTAACFQRVTHQPREMVLTMPGARPGNDAD